MSISLIHQGITLLCLLFCSVWSFAGLFSVPLAGFLLFLLSLGFVWFVCWFFGLLVCCRFLPCASDRRLARCTSSFSLCWFFVSSLSCYLGTQVSEMKQSGLFTPTAPPLFVLDWNSFVSFCLLLPCGLDSAFSLYRPLLFVVGGCWWLDVN